jgi:hypothetical protein
VNRLSNNWERLEIRVSPPIIVDWNCAENDRYGSDLNRKWSAARQLVEITQKGIWMKKCFKNRENIEQSKLKKWYFSF